jgi:DNA-binding IclR family transcriptional regulator
MLAARSADVAASLENLTRTAAAALSRKVGMATSVMQIVGDAVVISDFVAPEGDRQDARPGDRIPYVAPFAQSFVAWEPRAARRAWLARSGIANRAVEDRLEAVLAAIRNSGHAVQYMSLAVARAVHAIGALQQETLSDAMRDIIERLLVEITSLEYLPHELQAGKTYSVSAITAPVFDARGRVALSIGVHPFRELSRARIERIARMTTRATQELSRGTAPLVD